MPSTVRSLFQAAALRPGEVVAWGTSPTCGEPGVYVVALASDPDALAGLRVAPIADDRVVELLAERPELTVDGLRPDAAQLHERLRRMWLADESVLYIGRASTSIADRVRAYYRTHLGARAPHAGGWPLKTLEGLDLLSVHVARADDPAAAETAMIDAFVAAVSDASRAPLIDATLPLPFANLEDGRGRRKRHGIQGARAPYGSRKRVQRIVPSPPEASGARPNQAYADGVVLNVTAKDLEVGQIRVTRPAKRLLNLPERAADLQVYVRGELVACNWDARLGPDKERSGLLKVGRGALGRLLPDGPTQLRFRVTSEGTIHLD